MPDFVPGQLVFSKAGRDKTGCFVVLAVDGEFCYIADGKTRRLSSPKKKKKKHMQPTNTINAFLAQLIKSGAHIKDSDIQAAVKNFLKKAL